MESAQPILFRIGDVCVDRTTFQFEKALQMQKVEIRRFSSDGAKAIVHYTHCPMGMVFAVDVRLLNAVDGEGFLRPSPYTWLFKRPAGDTLCSAAAKRARKE
jgi:hypothetical protein